MRVLQLGPYPPPHGGVQTNLVGIRNYLREQGIPCAVINITRHRSGDGDDVYYPRSARQLLQLLLRLPYNVVHLHIGGDLTLRLLMLTLLCTLLPRRSVLVTFHSGGYPSSPAGRRARYWSFAGFVFRRLDGLIGVNPEQMRFFERLGTAAARTRLIPPYSVPRIKSGGPLLPVLERFFADYSPCLLSVGLLEPEYDLPLQVLALGKVREKFPGAGLILIGSGTLENRIASLVRSTEYAAHILVAGDVPHEMTLRTMAACDVVLRTTWYDGDSISVREALHLGVPVVATDTGMRPPGVRLTPIADLDALVCAVNSCLETRAERPAIKCATGTENLEAVARFYRDLAGEKPGRAGR